MVGDVGSVMRGAYDADRARYHRVR
jgi:hypothetical protein